MNETNNERTLESYLREIAHEIQEDKYMLMEYLEPVVDGCRAAFEVRVKEAKQSSKITDEEFQKYIDMVGDSFKNITICFLVRETKEMLSLIFDDKGVVFHDECIDPDVVVSGSLAALKDILNPDSQRTPMDLLGDEVDVHTDDAHKAAVALGLLCLPSLLKIARSGIDPSSLLAEDADTVIMAAASDMVTKMVQKWIDIQLEQRPQTDQSP